MASPIRADEVEPEAVTWLWGERVPRSMISIFAGRPEVGKGLVVAHIAAEVSRMRFNAETLLPAKAGDKNARWGQVLYSAVEDSHSLMTAPRLMSAGANMDNIFLWRFMIPNQQHELEQYIIKKNIDLLIIDPFAAHLGHGVSRHSDNIREVLTPLTELIEKTGTAVIIVEHVLKGMGSNRHALAAIGGSGSGLPAASRMAYLFGKDPADEDRRILAPVKSNVRETPQAMAFQVDVNHIENVGEMPYLLFEEECEFDPMTLVVTDRKTGVNGRPPDKRAAACEWLTNIMVKMGGKGKASEILALAQSVGMNTKTVRRARTDMGVVMDPVGGGRGCTWELPEEILKHFPQLTSKPDEKNSPPAIPDNKHIPGLSDADLDALLGYDGEGGDVE